jgi:hypothetical protein
MTIKQALKKYSKDARKAISAEMSQLLSKKVWKPLISKKQAKHSKHHNILPSSMFLKEKFLANGSFEKLKARLVAGGHRTDQSLYTVDDLASPTVCLESVMMVLSISANESRDIEAIDFPGAYLNANLAEPQLMKLDRVMAEEAVKLDPNLQQYVQQDGTMLVELTKALYGLPEAAKLWHLHLKDVLSKAGYQQSHDDQCLFNKRKYNEVSTLCLHVDDMLHAYTGNKLKEELHEHLNKTYQELKVQKLDANNSISYLGMDIKLDKVRKQVMISMPKYTEDLLEGFEGLSKAKTPAAADLFEMDNSSPKVDGKEFLSKLMKLMYLAKRVRYDILLPCTFLASRAKDPTEQDLVKLNRVFKYLNGTRDLFLTLKPRSLEIYAYVDSSYAVHSDAKGHSGRFVSLGMEGGPVYVKSIKQKLVSRSSTESELIGLTDAVSDVLWLRKILRFLGYGKDTPGIIFQDNTSTIFMSEQGRAGKTGNAKHIDVRYFFVKQHLDNGDLTLRHLPTEDMIADILTKPLQGMMFYKLREKLLNLPNTSMLLMILEQ